LYQVVGPSADPGSYRAPIVECNSEWEAGVIRRILKLVAGLLVSLVAIVLAGYIATNPEQPRADSGSARWLEPGPFDVGQTDFVFIDDSRPTDENRGFPGKPDRTLPTTIWYPENNDAAHPLIIHSHGIVSSRSEVPYLAEQLASYGYVIAAADHPLTSGSTPGGANAGDVVNQAADVSFLIDSVLALGIDARPFDGAIDTSRIGLTGYSLGGLTTSLTAYHPRWREPRVKAAVSMAGLDSAFTARFYETSDIPFLMVAGTADALVDYQTNAAIIPDRIANGSLLTIAGGSHLGFAGLAEPAFRLMHNPDTVGCSAVLAVLDEALDAVFIRIGGVEEGIVVDPNAAGVCETLPPAEAAHPGRQQMITQIGVLSFFESVFADEASAREAAYQQLTIAIEADFEEASFTN
jgi:dienelactone hydrolase